MLHTDWEYWGFFYFYFFSNRNDFCDIVTLAPVQQVTGPQQTQTALLSVADRSRRAAVAAPDRERGACAPSRTSSPLCRSCTGSGAAGTLPVPSPSWWTAWALKHLSGFYPQTCPAAHWLSHFRLHPVWDLIAEGSTAGRFSLTSTWRPMQILATSLTHPSAMPPTRSRSRRKGSGVSTPPATCSALASQDLVLASLQITKDPPKGFLPAPHQSPPRASPPPPNVRLKVAKLERGVISQARVITSVCPSLPSQKRRTGSLWSQLNSWTRRLALQRRTDWFRGHLMVRKLQWGAWAQKGPDQSGGHGGVRCPGGCVLSLRVDLQNQTTASLSSVCPRGCSRSPTRCDHHFFTTGLC